MKTLYTKFILLGLLAFLGTGLSFGQIISQYVDTDSGTTPKGIEIWNNTGATLDFSTNNLVIERYANGSSSATTEATISSGTLADGEVLVIGGSDLSAWMSNNYPSVTFVNDSFSFNGDDALEVVYGGTTTDVFGTIGNDPGSAWTGGGVSTRDSNIGLLSSVTTGTTTGFSDPSTRFETVESDPSILTGFGVAPVAAGPDNPSTFTSTTISDSEIDLEYDDNAAGDDVIIIFDTDNTFTTPSGTPPTAGSTFAGGEVLINASSVSGPVTFNHMGLTANTTYYYRAYSWDGTDYSIGTDSNSTTNPPIVNTFPYTDDFETATNDWLPSSNTATEWERGAPSGTTLNAPNSGSNAYGTDLDNNYLSDTEAVLTSPIFDNSSNASDLEVSFQYWVNSEADWDGLFFEYSLDGGASWTKLTTGLSNWYNNTTDNWWDGTSATGFTQAIANIPGSANDADVQVRFVFLSDLSNQEEGALIDDFEIDLAKSSASDIIVTSFDPTDNIDYTAFSAASSLTTTNALKVAEFEIRDGGATADADAASTILTDLDLDITNFDNLAAIAIFDGSTNVAEVTTAAATISFTSINSGSGISAADDNTKTFDIYATFSSSVTDNEQLEFSISAATADIGGSSFGASDAGGAVTSTTGDENRIEVTASALIFDQDVSDVQESLVMSPSPSVQAVDGNVNLDLDFTGSVSFAITSGTTTFDASATSSANAVGGITTFNNLIFDAVASGNVLTASATGLTDDTSLSFDVTAASCAGSSTTFPFNGVSGATNLEHSSSNLPGSSGESCGTNYRIFYDTTPGSDGSTNFFRSNSVDGLIESEDWGGEANFETFAIDVSGETSVNIETFGNTTGGGFNAGSEEFQWWYTLDGGSQVNLGSAITGTGSLAVGPTAVDVTGVNDLIVGFTFDMNGGSDGFEDVDVNVLASGSATACGVEIDFETQGSGYTTSITEQSDGSGNYFTQTNGTNISATFTGTDGSFFAAQDIDDITSSPSLPVELTVDNIDISTLTNLEFSIDLAEDDDGSNQDWDAPDYMRIYYTIDGGTEQNLLWVESELSSGSNGRPLIDTDFNGVGDGTEITDTFQTFTESIASTGTSMDIRIEFQLDAGNEDIALDNISVCGTQTSSTYTYTDDTIGWNTNPVTGTPPSTIADNIEVLAGTAVLDGVIEGKTLSVSSGATLELGTSAVLSLDGDITNDGTILFKSDLNGSAPSSAQLDEFTGTISGSGEVSVERYIPAKRAFRLLASPVTTTDFIYENWQESGSMPATPDGLGTQITGGAASLGFDQSGSNNPSMFTFNNTSQGWDPILNTNATKLNAETPYLTMVRGDRSIDLTNNSDPATETTLRATGELFTGPSSPVLSTGGFTDYSLVANPYQAVVDYSLATRSNLSNLIYIWDASIGGANARGGYVTVDVSNNAITAPNPTSSDASKYIAPGMSFFVQNNLSTSPSLTFNESNKATGQNEVTVFNTSSLFYINSRLYLTSDLEGGYTERDALGLRFSSDFTTPGSLEDGSKMTNPDENYAVMNEGLKSIDYQNLPSDGHTVNLYIANYTATDYSLTYDIENKPEDIAIVLVDAYLGTQTTLTGNVVYPFTVDANIPESLASDRFSLVFNQTTLSTNDNAFGRNFNLYPNPTQNGVFSINTPNLSGEVNVEISSLLGQQLYNQSLEVEAQEIKVNAEHLSSGMYLVKLTQDGQSFTTKLIVD